MTSNDSIIIRKADDMHLHARDGDALSTTISLAVAHTARAIIMPNLIPPVTTTEMAKAYRHRILSYTGGRKFTPLMTLYLTDQTTPAEIFTAKQSGIVFACKLYPCGATTNSASGVTNILGRYPVFRAMAQCNVPLLIHSEVTDPDIDIFDRERVFIERHVTDIIRNVPGLKIVLEHITTKFAVDYIIESPDNVAATITPHHLLENRNAMFKGGLRPHLYCVPILKSETDRKALLSAATSGSPHFFMGTDSAPHPKDRKESGFCSAGCFVGYASLQLYAEAFESVGKLSHLQDFTSRFGAQFYGLNQNEEFITLQKIPWKVPESFPFQKSCVIPYRCGETLPWSLSE